MGVHRDAGHPAPAGATYGSFPAACHYRDGTFVFARVQELCAKRSPSTGAAFSFWHPDLVTLHVWLWYQNPVGLYSGTNPWSDPSTAASPPTDHQTGARTPCVRAPATHGRTAFRRGWR